jgi:hypothetical protein
MKVSGQLYASIALATGVNPQYILGRRLGEQQSHSGCCGKEKNLFQPM